MDISHLRRDKDSPFTTPSDVLHALNAALQQRHPATTTTGQDDDDDNSNTPTPTAASSTTTAAVGRFELQKRLPDGSSVVASDRDLRAADMQSKLNQVVHHIADMTPLEQLAWAEPQRQYGNALYSQQKYEQAMDVYLTLLPVAYTHMRLMAQTMNNLAQAALALKWYRKTIQFCNMALERLESSEQQSVRDQEAEQETSASIQHDGMDDSSSKATAAEASDDDNNNVDAVLVAKLYFRRAKAHRLSGDYSEARDDLQHAQEWLAKVRSLSAVSSSSSSDNRQATEQVETDDSINNNNNIQETANESSAAAAAAAAAVDDSSFAKNSVDAFLLAIQKEERLLVHAAAEAKRNKVRAKQGLQQLWSKNNDNSKEKDAPAKTTTTSHAVGGVSPKEISRWLYANDASTDSRPRRQYSTLRAPSSFVRQRHVTTYVTTYVRPCDHDHRGDSDDDDDDEHEVLSTASSFSQYWNYYMAVVARVAERLLVVLGDEEWVRERHAVRIKDD